jgi:hypothetical protein
MIRFLSRIFATAITPPAKPVRPFTHEALADALGLQRVELIRSDVVPVRSHVRAKPVNHKQVALHDALRRAMAS